MTRLRTVAAALLLVAIIAGGCAGAPPKKTWEAGDSIICPHCGREFRIPEKLGK